MDAERARALEDAAETAARTVPEVANLYPSGSLVSNLLEAGALLIGAGDDASPVSVQERDGVLAATLAIGVRANGSAPHAAHAVREAVSRSLAALGFPDAEIHLTVVHIAESPSTTKGSPS